MGARRTKTDQRDAWALSEVSCRVDRHQSTSRRRSRGRGRHSAGCGISLVGARTKVINTVRGWLRGQGQRLGKGSRVTFTERVRAACGADLPDYVERQLRVVEALTAEINDADKELEAQAAQDETSRRLMTVPGVGPLTAIRYVAAIDDVGASRTPTKSSRTWDWCRARAPARSGSSVCRSRKPGRRRSAGCSSRRRGH